MFSTDVIRMIINIGAVIRAIVAITAPVIPATFVPTYDAILVAMGPGVILDIVIILMNSSFVIHALLSIISLFMIVVIPFPPPKFRMPILKNVMNKVIRIKFVPF
ncbi:hypothetical protein RJ61_02200 [Borrelia miyamotoi]|nr:hypothetical protein RJ61_02200 [Borrelia miyamotoi]AOW95681.1 hypothetical protein AXH25_02210 [Borrelia miyamotoi]